LNRIRLCLSDSRFLGRLYFVCTGDFINSLLRRLGIRFYLGSLVNRATFLGSGLFDLLLFYYSSLFLRFLGLGLNSLELARKDSSASLGDSSCCDSRISGFLGSE
jgi:hypothetical protein